MYFFATLLILAVVYIVALLTIQDFQARQTLAMLRNKAVLIADELEGRSDIAGSADVEKMCRRLGRQTATRISVILPDGKVVGDSEKDPDQMENHLSRPEVSAAMQGSESSSTRYSNTLKQSLMYFGFPVVRDGRVVAVVRTAVPLATVQETLSKLHQRIGVTVLVAIVLAALTSYLVARYVSRPLEEMRRGALAVADGDYNLRLSSHGSEEIGGLAESMNSMAAQLRDRINTVTSQKNELQAMLTRLTHLENVRRDFVANASHELKTPVTSIKGFVETLQDGAAEKPEDRRRFLEIIARQAERLDSIIGDILSLSRIEHEEERNAIPTTIERIRPVLDDAVSVCADRAERKKISIAVSCDADLEAGLNAPLIEQAVINLLDNAIKYSGEGTTTSIDAIKDSAGLRIRVSDQGQGIPPEHLPRIFERFYRVDKSRSRQLGGTGLGLAIVKHIANAHKGSVDVESVTGKGSIFTIRIPA